MRIETTLALTMVDLNFKGVLHLPFYLYIIIWQSQVQNPNTRHLGARYAKVRHVNQPVPVLPAHVTGISKNVDITNTRKRSEYVKKLSDWRTFLERRYV